MSKKISPFTCTPFESLAYHYTQGAQEAPTLVFLHGFCEQANMWPKFTAPFQNQNYSILYIEYGGFGQSALHPNYSLTTLSHQIQRLCQNLHIQTAIWIGHSLGGYLSLAVAEHHPQLVQGLTLFHSHPFADTPKQHAQRDKQIRFIEKYGVPPFAKHFIPKLFAQKDLKKYTPTQIPTLVKQLNQETPQTLIAAIQAMKKRPDRSHVLTNAPYPVLCIIGREDCTISYDTCLKQCALPTTCLVESLSIGHAGMYEAPQQCQHILNHYFQYLQHYRVS